MTDSRTRSFTRGVHVSALGGGDDRTFPNGDILRRLEGVPKYNILFEVDAGDTEEQLLGLISRGTYVLEAINHAALTSGTVALKLRDPAGQAADVDLLAAGDLTAAAEMGATAFFAPLAADAILVAQVTGGTAGEMAVLSLDVGVAKPEWK